MLKISVVRNAVAILLLIVSDAVCARQVPIENFFVPSHSVPLLSPNGRYLAMVSTGPKHPSQNILDIVEVQSRKVLRSFRSTGGWLFNHVAWVSNRRLIFGTRTNNASYSGPSGRLFAVDIDGHWIGPFEGDGYRFPVNISYRVVDPLPNDPCHFIASSYAQYDPSRAFLFNVGGEDCGEGYYSKTLIQSPFLHARFIADHHGRVRLAVGSDKFTGAPVWAYRGVHDSEWQHLPASPLRHFGARPLGFTSDDRRIYLLTPAKTGNHTLGLYEYDPATENMKLVYDDPVHDISRVMWGPGGASIVALIVATGKPTLILLDEKNVAARILRTAASKNPGMIPVMNNWSRDGSKAVVTVYDGRHPGLYYLVDVPTLRMVPLLRHKPFVPPDDMADLKPITFLSRDGVSLHGYLTLPASAATETPPLVVLPHDGPAQSNSWHFEILPQLLANRGYATLQVNYRGSSGRGETFQQAGLRQAYVQVGDVIDAAKWVTSKNLVDGDHVCLYGSGYGANLALLSAEYAPGIFKCVVGRDGIYDLSLLVGKDKIAWIRPGLVRKLLPHFYYYLRQIFGSDPAELKRQSSVTRVDKLKAALMLIHSGRGMTTPLAQVKQLKARLDLAGKHYEYFDVPRLSRNGHNFIALKKTLSFFDRYIGSHR